MPNDAGQDRSPADIRAVFSQNLKELMGPAPNVSALCRELSLNRTQFNRYLAGESFPRPDILQKICIHFGLDARILLQPLHELQTDLSNTQAFSGLHEFLNMRPGNVPEHLFPSGFYVFSRHSFIYPDTFIQGIIHVYRKDNMTYITGREPISEMRRQALPIDKYAREFRGMVMAMDTGLGMLVSRRRFMTGTFNFIAPVPSFENTYWQGYAVRTSREFSTTSRATRMVYQYLGGFSNKVLEASRKSGLCSAQELPNYHKALLLLDRSFK